MLNDELLFQTSHLSIYYNHVNEWLYVDWTGDQNMESVKDGCERILKFVKEELCHKILNDNTHVPNIWSDASDWVTNDWFPRLATSGLYYIAWVISPDTYSRLSAELILVQPLRNIVIHPFSDLPSAKTWLLSV
jgi:hypothetical protein